jgi:hypothetical protein
MGYKVRRFQFCNTLVTVGFTRRRFEKNINRRVYPSELRIKFQPTGLPVGVQKKSPGLEPPFISPVRLLSPSGKSFTSPAFHLLPLHGVVPLFHHSTIKTQKNKQLKNKEP